MTGIEFQQGMKRLGLSQVALADKLGLTRSTISVRCNADVVDEPYRYIMLGMLSEEVAQSLVVSMGGTTKSRMTGQEFERGMKWLGFSQIGLAKKLGFIRSTITARCKADVVDELYRYIMLGMLAERSAEMLALSV